MRVMPALFGVLPPFLTLHLVQAQTMFVQTDFPPMLLGMTWSSESSEVEYFFPQYWQ